MGVRGRLELGKGWGDNSSHSCEHDEDVCQEGVSVRGGCAASKGERCVVAECLSLWWYCASQQECVAEKTCAWHDNQERER